MKLPILITLLILLRSWPLGRSTPDYFAVWNVGQGSWATHVSSSYCQHFDMGGEKGRWPKLAENCFQLRNVLYLSHLDLDHISYIRSWQRRSRHLCLAARPRDYSLPKTSSWKKSLIKNVPLCKPGELPPRHAAQELKFYIQSKDPNTQSRIYEFRDFLLPGDSSRSAEKIWASLISPSIQVLVLGHHGSRTSTSELLLHHIPNVHTAVASARFKKYGHPHTLVKQTLQKTKTPLVTTEQWGHIIFEL